MFLRSIASLTIVFILFIAALLLVTSFTTIPVIARPRADLIVDPGESIQTAIDAANDGDTILINAGNYTESLTLSKPVSLTGVNSDTTIIHAVAGQRVLTVTGATISNSVVISGLTFTGGDATGGQGAGAYPTPTPIFGEPTRTATPTPTPGSQSTSSQQAGQPLPTRQASQPSPTRQISQPSPARQVRQSLRATQDLIWLMNQSPDDFAPTTDGLGGGLLITNSAQPELQAVRFANNLAGYGGGLYVDGASPLTLSRVDISGNVAMAGGGLYANASITLQQAELSHNLSLSVGGGANVSGTLTLLDSQVTHNEGGGLTVRGDLTAQQSAISFNTVNLHDRGGGITQSAGQLILDTVTVEGNTSSFWPDSAIFVGGSTVWILTRVSCAIQASSAA